MDPQWERTVRDASCPLQQRQLLYSMISHIGSLHSISTDVHPSSHTNHAEEAIHKGHQAVNDLVTEYSSHNAVQGDTKTTPRRKIYIRSMYESGFSEYCKSL